MYNRLYTIGKTLRAESAHVVCSALGSGFVTACVFGVLFSADCFWGLTSSLGALPLKSSPSPRPVGALVRAWTPSACRPVSQTTRRLRRVPSHPWTHQMSLKRRYILILSIILLPDAAPNMLCAAWRVSVLRFVSRCHRDRVLLGTHSSEKQLHSTEEIGFFLCALKRYYAMPKCTKGLWPLK